MKLWSWTTAIAAAMVTAASVAQAEDFPDRTVENIFPWAPGGAKAASQIFAEASSDELGVSMPVVSTPGPAGTKAFQTAMAKPAET